MENKPPLSKRLLLIEELKKLNAQDDALSEVIEKIRDRKTIIRMKLERSE